MFTNVKELGLFRYTSPALLTQEVQLLRGHARGQRLLWCVEVPFPFLVGSGGNSCIKQLVR